MSGWPNPPVATPPDNVGNALVLADADFSGAPLPPKASDRLRLSTLADVKRQMRLVYIEARNGTLPTAEAGKLIWMLSTLGNMIADVDLEKRVTELEGGRG